MELQTALSTLTRRVNDLESTVSSLLDKLGEKPKKRKCVDSTVRILQNMQVNKFVSTKTLLLELPDISEGAINSCLSTLARKGTITRLARGTYTLSPESVSQAA